MAPRPVTAILLCAMTASCPLVCAVEAAFHACEHTPDGGDAEHQHGCERTPHHRHDRTGEPIPHVEHSCICVAGTAVGHAVRVPALAPSAWLDAPGDWPFLKLGAARLTVRADGGAAELCRPPPDTPLLI
jgi:hypothetical protein